MNTRIRMTRLLSVAAIVVGICVATGRPVSADTCDPAYVTQVGNTFVVAPTGGDDTANLQCAFDAAAAGGTVQLMNGTYSIGQIAVNEFHGSFVGAGKEQTTITTLPEELLCPGTWPILLQFTEGDIRVADLTFDITDPYPCREWWNPVDDPGLLYPHKDLAVIVAIGGEILDSSHDFEPDDYVHANSSFENVAFRGTIAPGPASYWPIIEQDPTYFGVLTGIFIAGPVVADTDGIGRSIPMVGIHSVTNCSFEKTWQAMVTLDLSESTLTVGGSTRQGNRFANVKFALRALDHDASPVEFSHNTVVDVAPYGTAVLAMQTDRPDTCDYDWPSPTQYLISRNTFDVAGPVDAISIMDFGPVSGQGSKVHAVVSQNRIHLGDGEWGGVWGLGAQDVLVTNNKITGSGMAGIYFGYQGLPSSGWTIIGNNVQHLESDVAAIWLGPGTSLCTVAGGSNKTNVLDQGTDNIIAGLNTTGGNPPGPEIREAMQRKLEILNRFP
jgi:hypothetical protein